MVNNLNNTGSEVVKLSIGLANFSADDDEEPLDLRLDWGSWKDYVLEEDHSRDVTNRSKKRKRDNGQDIDNMLEEVFEEFDERKDEDSLFTLADFESMVEGGGYTGKVVEQETMAFRRMLFGYRAYTYNDIFASFDSHSLKVSSATEYVAQATAIGKKKNSSNRLYAREGLVFKSTVEDNTSLYVLTVLRNIEGIRAYEDWISQTKNYQKSFRSNLARRLFPKEFERIENFQGFPDTYKRKQITKIVNPVRTKHNKLLIRRRQILDLYKALGPIVLLDPIFLATNGKKGYPRSSPLFEEALKELLGRIEGDDIGQERYVESRQFVLRVMKSLGGEGVAQFVWEFLRTHCFWDFELEDDSDFDEYGGRWDQEAGDDGESDEDDSGSNGDQ